MRASDVGLVIAPRTWPKAAVDGQKWIEVSISQQTLVMWEGKKPIYATLVSTGREEYPTITGEFRINNKHITATMDSNESSSVGGGSVARVVPLEIEQRASKKKDAKAARAQVEGGGEGQAATRRQPARPQDAKKPAAPAAPAVIPKRGDGEYGVNQAPRRGHYALRAVPYIPYFAAGFALHRRVLARRVRQAAQPRLREPLADRRTACSCGPRPAIRRVARHQLRRRVRRRHRRRRHE